MEQSLYSSVLRRLKGEESSPNKHLAELVKVYGVRTRTGTIWDELYRMKTGKLVIAKDDETKCILMSHRERNVCLSIADTAIKLSNKYEVTPEPHGISLSLVSSVVNCCPFCCNKYFEAEKPVLVRWSNGLLYKAYVLSMEGRVCEIELDNYTTAKIDVKDVFDEFGQEVICTECQGGVSEPPDEIVLCDCCNTGYHQSCHSPPITDEVLSDDGDWYCHSCSVINNRASPAPSDLKPFSLRPEYNLSTLACMALLDKGPCNRSTILSWIQDNFKHYRDVKSDRWKARLSSTMANNRHWLALDRGTGEWRLCQHNLPTVLRHLSKVSSSRHDLPPSLHAKLPKASERSVVTSFSDVLPYDVYSLTWDERHRVNEEGVYCYCMGNGKWWKQMLQCEICKQWFHQACVSCLTKPLLCGEVHQFVCSVCNLGEEHFTPVALNQKDSLHLLMYHTVMTRYKGDFTLPVCLRMHIEKQLDETEWTMFTTPSENSKLENLAATATRYTKVFSVAAKNKNTTLFRLKVFDPPFILKKASLKPPLAPAPQGNAFFLPPGFVVDLSNNTSGLQVDGSPPSDETTLSVQAYKNIENKPNSNKKPNKGVRGRPKGSPNKKTKEQGYSSQSEGSDYESLSSMRKRLKKGSLGSYSGPRPKRTRVDKEQDVTCKVMEPVVKTTKEPACLQRLASGEKYRILGKRRTPSGELQYLIAWEGVRLPTAGS